MRPRCADFGCSPHAPKQSIRNGEADSRGGPVKAGLKKQVAREAGLYDPGLRAHTQTHTPSPDLDGAGGKMAVDLNSGGGVTLA